MNRKSFYYHFKDKYDLVNWIYYTECVGCPQGEGLLHRVGTPGGIVRLLLQKRTFYRKTLSVDGQNSFSEYFRDILAAILGETMEGILGQDPHLDFYVEFYTDAFLCALKRWLLAKDCMPAEEFTTLLRSCLLKTSTAILQQLPPSRKPPKKPKDALSHRGRARLFFTAKLDFPFLQGCHALGDGLFFRGRLGGVQPQNLLQGVVEDVALLLPPEPLVGAQAAVLVK